MCATNGHMAKSDIQLGELKRVITRLKEALSLPKDDIVRDSVIQRFEFTVELSWKVLQRFLKASGGHRNIISEEYLSRRCQTRDCY